MVGQARCVGLLIQIRLPLKAAMNVGRRTGVTRAQTTPVWRELAREPTHGAHHNNVNLSSSTKQPNRFDTTIIKLKRLFDTCLKSIKLTHQGLLDSYFRS